MNKLKWLPPILLVLSPFLVIGLLFVGVMFLGAIIGGNQNEAPMFSFDMSELAENEIPSEFIPYYQAAGTKYGVNWLLLASIHRQETNFSQNVAVSSAGAVGHTQFMDCTFVGWSYPTCGGLGNGGIPKSVLTSPAEIKKYGGYGVDANGDGKADPWDVEDAIHSTAHYISKNLKGATENEKIKNALFIYNKSSEYVQEVFDRFVLYADGFIEKKQGIGAVVIGNQAWPAPFTQRITSTYHDPSRNNHDGLDVAAPGINGTEIVAFMDGVVIKSAYHYEVLPNGKELGWGHYVRIDHGNNFHTIYAHMIKPGIAVGTKVKAGQVIGYVGSTGKSTGPHLHFETRVNGEPQNPLSYLKNVMN